MTQRLLMTTLLAVLAVFGQRGEYQTRRADIRGGGGNGKCTIEVEVDGSAEVEIRGDTARLRTLAGRPANWRRFVCNQPMPLNPVEFRFRGIDGRGLQQLVRDPRNGGPAVVRIDDPKSGREGYTFDIEWRGGRGGGDEYVPGGRGGGNNWGGWNGGWGDEIVYRGRGRGEFYRQGNRPTRIFGVDLFVRRNDGNVTVTFDTERGRDTLTFGGRIQRVQGNTILTDVRVGDRSGDEAGASGVMNVTIGERRRVTSIRMDGILGNRRFVLRWED
jgi:hypothetical protein